MDDRALRGGAFCSPVDGIEQLLERQLVLLSERLEHHIIGLARDDKSRADLERRLFDRHADDERERKYAQREHDIHGAPAGGRHDGRRESDCDARVRSGRNARQRDLQRESPLILSNSSQ